MANLLLIDDHPDVQEIMSRLLTVHGHHVEVCATAELALESLDRQLPDAVITDDSLPGMSGLELITIIRQNQRLAALPIIFVSADSSRSQDALRAGANDFWLKGADWILDRMAQLDGQLPPRAKGR